MSRLVNSDSTREEHSMSLVIKACDMCRKKKIRCEVTSDTCVQCIKYKTPCHFTPISVKRRPRRSVKDKRVEELEQKLKWMEDQLRAMENRQLEPDAYPGYDSRGVKTPEFDQFHTETSYLTSNIPGDDLRGPDSALVGGTSQASDLAAPPQKRSFPKVSDSQITIFPLNPSSVNVNFTGGVFRPLPPKEKALHLIIKSFQGFHSAFPLFDQAAFMSSFESLGTSINDLGWWACLNIVLALTHQFQHGKSNREEDREEDDEASGYFQNALGVSNQLMTMHHKLSSVQALLGMSLIVLGTPNQAPVSLLTSSAIKLAHRIGLHRRYQEPGLSAAEIRVRNRVFWIAYALDKDISLQTGEPPTQDDEDMDVELPFENNLIQPGESYNVDFFNFRTRLAIIQGQIYKRLLSVKASKQSATERVITARDLEAKLQTWRASVPIEFIRGYYEPTYKVPTLASNGYPISLQLSYFKSLAVVYGSLPILPLYQNIAASESPVKRQIMSSQIAYATEARKVLKLLEFTPRRKYACVWAVLHIFVMATTTLLTHTISNPLHPLAFSDLELIEPLLTLLGILANSAQNDKVGEMHQSCLELFQRAMMAVESFTLAGTTVGQHRTSGQPAGRESVEDFLRRMENISSGQDMGLSSVSPSALQEFAFEDSF